MEMDEEEFDDLEAESFDVYPEEIIQLLSWNGLFVTKELGDILDELVPGEPVSFCPDSRSAC